MHSGEHINDKDNMGYPTTCGAPCAAHEKVMIAEWLCLH